MTTPTDTSRLPFAPLTDWGLLDHLDHERWCAGQAALDAVRYETTHPHLVESTWRAVAESARRAHALTVAYRQRFDAAFRRREAVT